MQTTIGKFDKDKRTVAVSFIEGDIIHKRDVNACLDDAGAYAPEATAARVAKVALGVAAKIELGVIKASEPESEPEA